MEFAGGALRCGEYVTLRKVGDASQKASASSDHLQISQILRKLIIFKYS